MEEASRPVLSIVVPCFNEQEALPLFADELARVMVDSAAWPFGGGLPSELVLIDDGSTDSTLDIMRALALRDDLPYMVRYIALSRNFGKESALYAGLSEAMGDFVATMDADLQDPPSLLPQMYAAVASGEWDSVATRRASRVGESSVRSTFARLFYRVISRLSGVEIVDGARDFRMMKRTMVDAVLAMPERNRFTKGIYGWLGFRTKWISYENIERMAGSSKWSFTELVAYALDGIAAFSEAPLALASWLGAAFCLIALVLVVVVVVRAAILGDPVAGWPSLMTAVLLVGGVQLLCLGVVGHYLAKTYVETKRRPIYLVRERGSSGEGRRRAQ